MRVLMLSWEYPPHIVGGLGHHVQALVPELLAADPTLQIYLVTPTFDGEAAEQSYDRLVVARVPVGRPLNDTYYADIQAANQRLVDAAGEVLASYGGLDLVHAHDWLVGFAAEALHDSLHVPLLATIHATERGRWRGSLHENLARDIDMAENALVQDAEAVITCSDAMSQEVHEYFETSYDKILVIPNGVYSAQFDALRNRDLRAFRAAYAAPGEQLVFNVGRLVFEKGTDLLVEAVPRVLEQVPTARFVIGGTGPMADQLEHRVREMSLARHVQLTGYLSYEQRDYLYMVADCTVFPSRYEPFGIVALEAMAAGTPLVVSNVGGLGSVVSNGVTGITVDPEDVEALAWGIIRTLQNQPEARQRAERALDMVHERYSWPLIARKTLAAYRQVLDMAPMAPDR